MTTVVLLKTVQSYILAVFLRQSNSRHESGSCSSSVGQPGTQASLVLARACICLRLTTSLSVTIPPAAVPVSQL
jgi:hypothetical protein